MRFYDVEETQLTCRAVFPQPVNFLKGGVDFRILGGGDDSATAAFFAS